MYLGIVTQEYVKEEAVVAVAAVPEYREETEDGSPGEILQKAIPAVAAKAAVMGTRVYREYLEDSIEVVIRNLADEIDSSIKYYRINPKVGSCTLSPVTLKAERKTAPAREVAELVVGGQVVGEAEV